jgi:hypothetical protein
MRKGAGALGRTAPPPDSRGRDSTERRARDQAAGLRGTPPRAQTQARRPLSPCQSVGAQRVPREGGFPCGGEGGGGGGGGAPGRVTRSYEYYPS